jgi:hypothetical protein
MSSNLFFSPSLPLLSSLQSRGGPIIDRGQSQFTKYRTMVTDMDKNVGEL